VQSEDSPFAFLVGQLDIDFTVAQDGYSSTTAYGVVTGWCFSEIGETAEGS